MNWVIAKDEHNRGSTDPIVARTVMQAGEIVPLYEFSRDKEQAIVHVFEKLRRHLHQCDDLSSKIVAEINEKTGVLHKNLVQSKSQKVLYLPAAENLTNDLETYLYHAKLTFRELKDLFFHSLDKKFKPTTQYSHIANWSEKRFGINNSLSRWLRSNCQWIQKIIDSRNAVEHPENHTLEIKNFHTEDGGIIRTPSWSLDGEPPRPILQDMEILTINMLEFSEILLLYCLRNVKDISPIIIAEIPIENRNSNVPVRFIATLAQDVDENGMYKWKN
ncbi:MAG TPA: hypothetical protein ENH34_02575 [Phycisphaerales bacterium]|nr:hypothetical protein [Phycisphaerales bacterium]